MAAPDLSNNHRDTLNKIFAHPVSHNVEWQDVIGLLGAVGDIEERHGNLAVTLGEDSDTLEDMVEPFLIQAGFLTRTPQGRKANLRAYDHLGLRPRAGDQAELL